MMKKIIILTLACILFLGCGKDEKQEEINNFIKNSSINEIVSKLDENITYINMFPNKDYEEEFIYYIKALINNIDIFAKDDLNTIYEHLSINYDFGFNSLNYTRKDYNNDLEIIKTMVNNK